MKLEKFAVRLESVQPLLMHNGRLVNPMDPFVKAIKEVSSKRKKTDEDYEQLARLEWEGSLYHDAKLGPYMPGENIDAVIREGAKQNKLGKSVQRGVRCDEEMVKLEYKGPRDPEGLWNKGFVDQRPVRVTTSKVVRTRPRFNRWALDFNLSINSEAINPEDVEMALQTAGDMIGLCEWYGRYGLFFVAKFEELKGKK